MGSRVLVVDDSAFMRRALAEVLEKHGHIVVGRARNGREAIDLAGQLRPDVVTLDIEMPEMDGLTALPRIRRACSARVIMVSSLTREGSAEAIRALHMGASDCVAKSHSQFTVDVDALGQELAQKVRALTPQPDAKTPEIAPVHGRICHARLMQSLRGVEVFAVGSSTGGPGALLEMLTQIGGDFSKSMVIAQHMPEIFTQSLAKRLDETLPVRVLHAEHRMLVRPGFVYIAPGGHHIRMQSVSTGYRLDISDEPADALYKPSVNELFHSVARVVGERAAGIVLTGMGDDGVLGAQAMHARGSTIIGQSRESSVVYGMPKAVAEAGLIAAALTPEEIGKLVSQSSRDHKAAG